MVQRYIADGYDSVQRCADGDFVTYKDYAELEKQRDALVAELKEISGSYTQQVVENVQQVSMLQKILKGRPGGVYFNKYEDEIKNVLSENIATTDAVRELMARGVDDLISQRKSEWLDTYIDDAKRFAQQLREGGV